MVGPLLLLLIRNKFEEPFSGPIKSLMFKCKINYNLIPLSSLGIGHLSKKLCEKRNKILYFECVSKF